MIEISIVSGTYNRLDSLKRMVASVRRSVGDFSYEIILVDGGSDDGTIEWCESQSDVILIRQGKLLGAVKAFNAGAAAANGRYVILANDDVYFIDESILTAYSYMEDNPKVGIGCFYQNRDGKDWHVENMPAVDPNGNKCSVVYGQVCIVPTWLGEKVGWWGDYLHTYGGDNELSCNVWEAGYAVAKMECCCISDMMIHDDLRLINGGDPLDLSRQGRTHPDTEKWTNKWTIDGKCGPRISVIPKYDSVLTKKLRIMYVPLFEPGNMFQRKTKHGLRSSLSRQGSVLQYDYMEHGIDLLFDYANAYKPKLFIFQIQNIEPFYEATIMQLRQQHPDAIFINWNGDYHPENFFDVRYMEMMKQFHLIGTVTTQVQEEYDAAGIEWFYWQIGYEESDAKPDAETPEYDIVYLGNGYTDARLRLGEFLVGLRGRGYKVGLYGSWPNGWADGENLYNFDAGQKLMRNSKIIISTQQYPDGIGFVSNRLIQALASGGGMVLQQKFEGMDLLGLQEGVHLDVWEDLTHLHDLIEYWLDDDERVEIASTGTEYSLKNHSFDVRVDELFQELERRAIL